MKNSKGRHEQDPIERVAPILEGMTLDEAEDVAVAILAQVMAKRVYVEDRGAEYFDDIMTRVCSSADDYARDNESSIAVSRFVLAHKDDIDSLNLN